GKSEVPYLVSAWQHLVGYEYGAQTFADAYVDFVKKWDWQWVKVNPRACYYAEAWGSQYDKNNYAGYIIPKKIKARINNSDDVNSISKLDVTTNSSFVEAFEAVKTIRERLQDRAVVQTLFSPLSVLLQLADLPLYPGDEYATPEVSIDDVIFSQPKVAKQALQAITDTLVDYAVRLVTPVEQGGAGLDGIFYAVTGTVSDDYFDAARYAEFSKPYDQVIIDAVHKANPHATVILHTCRSHSHPEWFDTLGVEAIHWDQYAQGNPHADIALRSTPVAGANFREFDPDKSAEQVQKDIEETIRLRGSQPFLLAPSCTVTTPANESSLDVLSKARIVQ
ncbi:MAG: uroporphyrinogen decarboxylase family protein, partial [Bifidobacteriaceae bacterium]|nr:uroporphyrinogen decarboxylase family protein [Bifidobacteriaceae bacterium]